MPHQRRPWLVALTAALAARWSGHRGRGGAAGCRPSPDLVLERVPAHRRPPHRRAGARAWPPIPATSRPPRSLPGAMPRSPAPARIPLGRLRPGGAGALVARARAAAARAAPARPAAPAPPRLRRCAGRSRPRGWRSRRATRRPGWRGRPCSQVLGRPRTRWRAAGACAGSPGRSSSTVCEAGAAARMGRAAVALIAARGCDRRRRRAAAGAARLGLDDAGRDAAAFGRPADAERALPRRASPPIRATPTPSTPMPTSCSTGPPGRGRGPGRRRSAQRRQAAAPGAGGAGAGRPRLTRRMPTMLRARFAAGRAARRRGEPARGGALPAARRTRRRRSALARGELGHASASPGTRGCCWQRRWRRATAGRGAGRWRGSPRPASRTWPCGRWRLELREAVHERTSRRLLLAVLWLAATPASAHKPSDAYLTLRFDGGTLAGQWDIALRDLEHAIGLDADGDGAITWGELADRERARRRLCPEPLDGHRRTRALPAVAGGAAGRRAHRRRLCRAPVRRRLPRWRQRRRDRLSPVRRPRSPASRPAARRGRRRHAHGRARARRAELSPSPAAPRPTCSARPWSTSRTASATSSWATTTCCSCSRSCCRRWCGAEHGGWQPVSGFGAAAVEVAKVVTAFTVAHSITLLLATLGLVDLPSRLVESAIAATIVLAALNNLYPVVTRRMWLVAFGFGLVHGLGFAGALAALGLPPRVVPALAARLQPRHRARPAGDRRPVPAGRVRLPHGPALPAPGHPGRLARDRGAGWRLVHEPGLRPRAGRLSGRGSVSASPAGQ